MVCADVARTDYRECEKRDSADGARDDCLTVYTNAIRGCVIDEFKAMSSTPPAPQQSLPVAPPVQSVASPQPVQPAPVPQPAQPVAAPQPTQLAPPPATPVVAADSVGPQAIKPKCGAEQLQKMKALKFTPAQIKVACE